MVDDVRNNIEAAETKEALDRSRLARERREAEQRKRLDELRAHAAAAQAQREKRDDDRRKRQAEQRSKDDERRTQVEERKRAIWEASISRREALLQRERDRAERLERARAARSAPRPAFAFGSSTPRLLDPLDSAGFFWAARSTNPIDQMNFFESLAASTTNVMYVSAPLTRRASALQLDTSDTDTKDEADRSPGPPAVWSSVARRRTDLVPTVPLGRAPGRAHSMTRLDRLPQHRPIHSASPSMHHLNRTQCRSGETTPGSRPGSAMSNATPGAGVGVIRRTATTSRKPRPASIAGTGVNTPRGGVSAGGDVMSQSVATTPSVSRDSTVVVGAAAGAGDAPRRAATTPRRPRPVSMHASHKPSTPVTPAEGKPPLHRKPKPSKEHDKSGSRGKSMSASPGRTLSPSRTHSKESSLDKDTFIKVNEIVEMSGETTVTVDRSQVNAAEVTQKLEALQINTDSVQEQKIENKEMVDVNIETKLENVVEMMIEEKTSEQPVHPVELQKQVEKKEEREDKKEPSQEKTEDNEMTASMTARRITTEEQAKAALAERRRRAREELERQAELERQRLQREAEEEAVRQRLEEERQRREEEEARELAKLQRQMEEVKLRKAIEVQQQLERDEAERKSREEAERQARVREDEEKRKAAEEAEKLRREEAEREEKERFVRKQRVEAIMARTRLRKAEEDKKNQEKAQSQTTVAAPLPAPVEQESPEPAAVVASVEPAPVAAGVAVMDVPSHDNGNVSTGDLLGFGSSQVKDTISTSESLETNSCNDTNVVSVTTNNGNVTADLLGLSEQNNTEDKIQEQSTQKQIDNNSTMTTNNGNDLHLAQNVPGIGLLSANFLQTERTANENQTKMTEVPKLLDEDFTTHNGHGTLNHPLTLQNAI